MEEAILPGHVSNATEDLALCTVDITPRIKLGLDSIPVTITELN